MRRLARVLGAVVIGAIVLAASLSRRRRRREPLGLELLIVALLALASLGALCFVGLFAFYADTQLLGLTLGVSLAGLAGALILAGNKLVRAPTEVEDRPIYGDPEQVEAASAKLGEIGEGITRRRLLGSAAAGAALSLAGIAVVPLFALGPRIDSLLSRTPWRAGRRLVDDEGKPIAASEIETGGWITAFPEGVEPDNLTAPIVVVRVDPGTLRMPRARRHWTPEGFVAYSKICTHAGCAVSLFRSPLSPTTVTGTPALVCPCHYSTFDVLDGASVEFGPAGRPLPQLPLRIDRHGFLRAGGPLSGPVGPAWWGDD